MKQFLFTIAGVFVGLILFFIIIPILFIMSASSSSKPVTPSNAIISLDLRQPLTDITPNSPFGNISGSLSVVDIVRKLEAAETDSNIKGLIVRAPEAGLAPAHAEEIRQAFLDFKESGKFIIAHAQGFENPILSNFVSISAADEIWLQKGSDFAATGLVSETMFLGGMFEKFGIKADFDQFYEYKNAANVYTQKDYTEAHRESTVSMLTSVYNSYLADISLDRGIAIEKLKTALDAAPFSATDALTLKLVHKLGTPEEAIEAALNKIGGQNEGNIIDFSYYMPAYGAGPNIALVGAEGPIETGPNEQNPFASENMINSDAMAEAVRQATDNKSVKAIVLRVSSPGGSAIGSEQVWAAIERAKAMKKPVVVSMGAYAASGGYYISTNADKIFALPTTITGSIGVLGGKFAINDTLNKYTGANISSIEVGGPYVSSMGSGAPMTNSQKEAFHKAMERIYIDFTGKVAKGRNLPIETVQSIAKGRVWTGSQAKDIKLVDNIGGLRNAIEHAKTLANIEPASDVSLILYPEAGDPLAALSALMGGSVEAAKAASVLSVFIGEDKLINALKNISHSNDNIQTKEYIKVR